MQKECRADLILREMKKSISCPELVMVDKNIYKLLKEKSELDVLSIPHLQSGGKVVVVFLH